jgi:hypothetical protein
MAWGGDIMNANRGYSPTATNAVAPVSTTGFERTLYDTTYDIAGSDFMSTDYQNMTSIVHNMSESYLHSRSIYTASWLFRVEERPGYIGVGAKASKGRGRYRTAPFTNLSKPAKVAVEFKICPMANMGTDVFVYFRNAGFITEAYIDGVQVALDQDNHGYSRNGRFEGKGRRNYKKS